MTQEERHIYMTETPVKKLILKLAVPTIISMLVTSIYNMADTYFVSHISTEASAAVGVTYSIMAMIQAIGFTLGMGSGTYVSRLLGMKEYEKANRTVSTAFFTAFILGLLLCICTLPFLSEFVTLLGAIDSVKPYAKDYAKYILIGAPFMTATFVLNNQLRAQGNALFSMIGISSGTIINIILDPVMIYNMKMGVAGAAIATVIGQIVGGIISVYFNVSKNHEIKFEIKGFRPDMETIGNIYKVGLPSIIMQSIGSIMTYGMNQILIAFSSTATAVFGVYFKLQSFFFMPLFGLNNGMVPIIAFNFGAGKRSRMLKTLKLSYLYAFVLLFLAFIVFETMPATLLGLFEASEDMVLMGVPALRIIGVHFLIAWFCIISGSLFQALGNGVYSLVVSVARQLFVLLPAAYILSKIGGLSAVWWSFPIAELASLTFSAIFLFSINRKIIRNVADNV